MSWVPYGYIFETPLIQTLLNNFFVHNSFRNDTLPCLVEIASLKIEDTEEKQNVYIECQFNLFITFLQKLNETTNGVNLFHEYKQVPAKQLQFFEVFCQQITLLITEFMKNYFEKICEILDTNQNEFTAKLQECCKVALDYLIQLSQIENEELYRINMEFWNFFTFYIKTFTRARLPIGGFF